MKKTMRVWFAFLSLAGACLLFSAASFQQGCVGGVPPLSAIVVTSTPTLPPYVISNFENGGSTFVSSTLMNTGGHPGYFNANTYGGGGLPNSINSPFVVSAPGNGSNYAININCPLSSTGAYEADQLVCTLTSGGSSYYYDASAFSGIQFDLNILPNDTSTHRVFQVAVDVTTINTSAGGTCASNCYNHYQATLPAGSTGGWTTKSYTWSQIAYPGFGTNNGPLANHLDKILFLQWAFDNQASVTVTQTNFWIDNVQFLP